MVLVVYIFISVLNCYYTNFNGLVYISLMEMGLYCTALEMPGRDWYPFNVTSVAACPYA